jgi:hypothetical protein
LNRSAPDAYTRTPMRRFAALLVGLFAIAGVCAAPAFATFHLEMANEVMLASSSGDSGVQFVELLDHGGTEEAFTPVFAPYRLVIYDAAGNKLGEHELSPSGLRDAAMADREYLLSTAAANSAFGVTGDEVLDVNLPLGAGQACFEANPDPPAFSCLTWGTITKPVPTNSMGTGSVHGPVPANGKSDQRLTDHSVVPASPTPKAPNKADPGGPSGKPFAGMRFGKRTVKVDQSRRARVQLKCPAKSGGCTGRLKLRRVSGKPKSLGSAKFNIAAGRRKAVVVKLSSAAMKRLRKAGHLKARGIASARDAAGHPRTTRAKLTLKAP